MKKVTVVVFLVLLGCFSFLSLAGAEDSASEDDIKVKSLPLLISVASEEIIEIMVKENKTNFYDHEGSGDFYEKYYELRLKDNKNVILRSPSILSIGFNSALMKKVEIIKKARGKDVRIEFYLSSVYTETDPIAGVRIVFTVKSPVIVKNPILKVY